MRAQRPVQLQMWVLVLWVRFQLAAMQVVVKLQSRPRLRSFYDALQTGAHFESPSTKSPERLRLPR